MPSWKSHARASFVASVVRLGGGFITSDKLGPRPQKPLELYDFEACPFCRKVRETLSFLDLEAMIYPVPKGGTRFRGQLEALGGKAQMPFLVDPNTDTKLYESNAIIRYLVKTYGTGTRPLMVSLGPITMVSSVMTTLLRKGHGREARASRPPGKPLELWSYEASSYSRLARERLCELELPYLLHNVAKKSPSRRAFAERSGKMQVPYLVDPNTGVSMFESKDICDYLDRTYALAPQPLQMESQNPSPAGQ